MSRLSIWQRSAVLLLLLGSPGAAQGDEYPSKPIKLLALPSRSQEEACPAASQKLNPPLTDKDFGHSLSVANYWSDQWRRQFLGSLITAASPLAMPAPGLSVRCRSGRRAPSRLVRSVVDRR